jgi:glycosyltransferase involved in cell wall biosynthesis
VRVLYVLGDVPARGTGGHTRAASTIRALARAAEVEVIWPERPELQPDPALAEIAGVAVRPVTGHALSGRARSAARVLARGRPVAVAQAVKPALAEAAAERLAGGGVDVLVADQLAAAVACLELRPAGNARSVYNANNIEWRLRAGGGAAERLRWAGVRRLERDVLAAYDQSWMVSEADRDAALELCPGADVRVIANAVDMGAIEPIERPGSEPVVLLVGSFDYSPNRRGLRWLVDEVMPAVWRSRPEARLRVVGRWPGRPWEPGDGRVEVLGFVPDLAAAYAGARCCVAPLVVGGGTPLKVVEALAYGLPLVATTTAVRALSALQPGRDLIVADAAADFAAALLEVLDPSYDHGERGRRARGAIEASYSVDAIAGEVARAISE